MADLLRSGKAENARIRVESVMREEQMLQAYEGTATLGLRRLPLPCQASLAYLHVKSVPSVAGSATA